jgi:phage shock protein C
MLFLKGIVSLKEAYMKNKLYKSNSDKMVSGVCGGIAEYFNIDSTIVRLALVLFILAGGSGLLAYLICAIVIPQNPNPNY